MQFPIFTAVYPLFFEFCSAKSVCHKAKWQINVSKEIETFVHHEYAQRAVSWNDSHLILVVNWGHEAFSFIDMGINLGEKAPIYESYYYVLTSAGVIVREGIDELSIFSIDSRRHRKYVKDPQTRIFPTLDGKFFWQLASAVYSNSSVELITLMKPGGKSWSRITSLPVNYSMMIFQTIQVVAPIAWENSIIAFGLWSRKRSDSSSKSRQTATPYSGAIFFKLDNPSNNLEDSVSIFMTARNAYGEYSAETFFTNLVGPPSFFAFYTLRISVYHVLRMVDLNNLTYFMGVVEETIRDGDNIRQVYGADFDCLDFKSLFSQTPFLPCSDSSIIAIWERGFNYSQKDYVSCVSEYSPVGPVFIHHDNYGGPFFISYYFYAEGLPPNISLVEWTSSGANLTTTYIPDDHYGPASPTNHKMVDFLFNLTNPRTIKSYLPRIDSFSGKICFLSEKSGIVDCENFPLVPCKYLDTCASCFMIGSSMDCQWIDGQCKTGQSSEKPECFKVLNFSFSQQTSVLSVKSDYRYRPEYGDKITFLIDGKSYIDFTSSGNVDTSFSISGVESMPKKVIMDLHRNFGKKFH